MVVNKHEILDFSQFEDEFGNLKEEYEIIRYDKLANGEWEEQKRFNSSKKYYVLDGKIYYRHWLNHGSKFGSLSELNMDFNSPTCGACYQVGRLIEGEIKITGNDVLFSCESEMGGSFSLYKQSYSDDTCFYTLKEQGVARAQEKYGSRNLNDIIDQVEREKSILLRDMENDNAASGEVFEKLISFKQELIDNMEKFVA